MGRLNRIWFRKDIGWWMVTLGGEKVRLATGRQNKTLAQQKFHELTAGHPFHEGVSKRDLASPIPYTAMFPGRLCTLGLYGAKEKGLAVLQVLFRSEVARGGF